MASNSPLKIIVEEQVDFTPPKCRYQENFNSTDHSSSSREEDCSFVLEETIKHKVTNRRIIVSSSHTFNRRRDIESVDTVLVA